MMKHRQYHKTEKDLVDNENIPDQVVLERNRYQKKEKKNKANHLVNGRNQNPIMIVREKEKRKLISLIYAAVFVNEFASVGK